MPQPQRQADRPSHLLPVISWTLCILADGFSGIANQVGNSLWLDGRHALPVSFVVFVAALWYKDGRYCRYFVEDSNHARS